MPSPAFVADTTPSQSMSMSSSDRGIDSSRGIFIILIIKYVPSWSVAIPLAQLYEVRDGSRFCIMVGGGEWLGSALSIVIVIVCSLCLERLRGSR